MIDLAMGDMGYALIEGHPGLQSVGVSSKPSALLIMLDDDARVTGIDPFGVTWTMVLRLSDLENFVIFRVSLIVLG